MSQHDLSQPQGIILGVRSYPLQYDSDSETSGSVHSNGIESPQKPGRPEEKDSARRATLAALGLVAGPPPPVEAAPGLGAGQHSFAFAAEKQQGLGPQGNKAPVTLAATLESPQTSSSSACSPFSADSQQRLLGNNNSDYSSAGNDLDAQRVSMQPSPALPACHAAQKCVQQSHAVRRERRP
jgi:hypothetical protein